MSTVNSINGRKLLLIPVFAAIAVYAQGSHAADTQDQVRAVLEGTRTQVTSGQYVTSSDSLRVPDIQDGAREVLLGTYGSKAKVRVAGSESNTGSNGQSSVEALKLTQQVVVGRAAS
jgi:hypothetical protein